MDLRDSEQSHPGTEWGYFPLNPESNGESLKGFKEEVHGQICVFKRALYPH